MSLHESSITDFGFNAPPRPLPQQEWDLPGPIPRKSTIMDYGYIVKGQTIGCTAQELIEAIVQRHAEISFVWTPETPQPVRPEQVPFLTEAFRRLEVGQARNYMWFGAIAVAIGAGLALVSEESTSLFRNLLIVVGGLGLAAGNWRYWRARNYTQDDAISEASNTRFTAWAQKTSVSGYTMTIVGAIIVVTILQGLAENSTALTGLVKPAVWRGEVWRLFTAPLMHTGLDHFLVVAFALIWFSKITEQAVRRSLLPLLFIVSAAVGSLVSVVLSPHTSSMGGSGGIMGLLGLIVVAAYRKPAKFPPRFFKRMLTTLASVGLLGFFDIPFIDNATHLGGAVTGLVLGWLCTGQNRPPITAKLERFAGAGGVLALASTAVFAVSRLLS